MLSGWLGGFSSDLIDDLPQTGRLLTIEEVGEILEGTYMTSEPCFLMLELFEIHETKWFFEKKNNNNNEKQSQST